MTRTLTILICTHNRADLLEQTLRYLDAAQRPNGWRVEVLVVANACKDATVARLRAYRECSRGEDALPLSWVEVPRAGKSHALNRTLPGLGTAYVAFVDDDHRVDGHYLVAVTQAVEQYPQADIYCGRILPDWDGSEPVWIHDRGEYRIYPLPVPRFDLGDKARELTPDSALPGGGNLFLRTDIYASVGDFDTDLGPVGHDLGGGEDLEWLNRALVVGARLQYVPEVVQYHYVDSHRLTLRYVLKKAFLRSATTMRLSAAERRQSPVPVYLLRKLLAYLTGVLLSWSWPRRRFYLVRLAAALGEARGSLQAKRDRKRRAADRVLDDSP